MGIRSLQIHISTLIRSKRKIFGIGLNKTGTTSLGKALSDLGYHVAPQQEGEILFADVIEGRMNKLKTYCRKYEAFQDIPFSMPGFYKKLYALYPNARFILTTRNNSDVWYKSLTEFHSRVFNNGNGIPNKDDLLASNYIYKGYAYESIVKLFGAELYNEKFYKAIYDQHIEDVSNFFDGKPNCKTLNISEPNSYLEMCDFLGVNPKSKVFPHVNKMNDN
ncbi:MAG: hypothetical protein ACI8Q1_001832 [Parvicella sp.]|jgi:hypothetical protein